MSGMLASVNSIAEALIVQHAGVDIIDLKQPSHGALGALSVDDVTAIVRGIQHKTPVSATIGDMPMQPERVYTAVQAMAATGVDYVKIGFFPEGDTRATLEKLKLLTQQGIALIAVLFADTALDFSIIPALKQIGFKGVMLDTMDKKAGSLTQIMSLETLQHFVNMVNEQSLLCGLAGSLRQQDIVLLLPLKPDYLGFRGALCEQHNRVGQLNQQAIAMIKHKINAGQKASTT
jgi:(5-formylfuran-3-yl)methyl phosphate synthase